ncbi:DUF1985 domain-containing protein [Abeliophyllum distichum]|uniref:DUF1985 domain-containing protein n=1 Tax=Abeliophyllum distichum TaxID=126358 RepID=A0ABD1THZ5_9LAMI
MFTTTYKRSVEDFLMVLADSDEMNSYVWEKELFKITISSLKSGLRNKSMIAEGDGKPYMAYRISGFVTAFQVWIYETLPMLDGKICTQIGSRCPHIANLTSNIQGRFNCKLNLGKDIFSRPDVTFFV